MKRLQYANPEVVFQVERTTRYHPNDARFTPLTGPLASPILKVSFGISLYSFPSLYWVADGQEKSVELGQGIKSDDILRQLLKLAASP